MHGRSQYLARLVLRGGPATDQLGDVAPRNLKNKFASTVCWAPVCLWKRFVLHGILEWRDILFLDSSAPEFGAVMGYESRFLETRNSRQYHLL